MALSWAFGLWDMAVRAQQFDTLIKGGHVIDGKNQIDSVMDVAVSNGKIAQVSTNIPAGET